MDLAYTFYYTEKNMSSNIIKDRFFFVKKRILAKFYSIIYMK